MFGIDLGIVQNAELDGIEPELLRHLIDCDFQRHHAGRFTGRAHGICFREIEHRKTRRCQTVGSGIKQARLMDRAVGFAVSADRRTNSHGQSQ